MKIKKFGMVMLAAGLIFLSACGNNKNENFVTGKYYNPAAENGQSTAADQAEASVDGAATGVESTEADDGKTKIGTDLFLITVNDMQAQCLILEQLASGKQYMYNYSLVTRFLDKYGNRTSVSNFESGRVICVGKKDEKGRLLEAQISDAVWEYPNVTRFSVDEERGILRIADTNYSCGEDVFVHSDSTIQRLADLTELDTLRVTGIDKEILSISIVTGHGELQLTNTDVFDGSFIQVGAKIFAEVTGEMTMDIPEGTYTVAVANNGYGGSTEVEIKQGQKTVLDLDTLKGEGSKYGEILFAVDVADAVLQIDGKTVDYSEPVSVRYGVHTLTVMADSYDTYSKKLFVNSEKATIGIGLSGDGTGTVTGGDGEDTDNQSDEVEKETSTRPGNLAGSLAGSHGSSGNAGTTGGTGKTDQSLSEAEIDAIVQELLNKDKTDGENTDYLSTISKILSSLSE